jgi:predicted 2-oxoglutarate/Fe(II)-dependent dioxygenase YbiX
MHDPYNLISKNLLTNDQCDILIEQHNTGLNHVVQSTHRDVEIKEIVFDDVPKLKEAVLLANNFLYQFDLNGFNECYFGKYSTNSHYNKLHLDSGPGETTRKLSFTLFLNEDFDGGEFYMLDEHIEKKKGKLLVFPSFLPHKVSSVTAGTRYAIFGFLSGPRLK